MMHSLPTRLLHLLVAAAIVFQLLDSLIMRVPRSGRVLGPVDRAVFAAHEYGGLTATALVGLFWVWLLVRRRGTPLGQLFPWLSARHLAGLRDAALLYGRRALRLRLPDAEAAEALPSAIQGLGLLLALAMAATGTIGYLAWTPGTPMTGMSWLAFEVHGTLANLLWGYLVVHVGAVVVHELFGHRLLRRMAPTLDADRAAAHARQ